MKVATFHHAGAGAHDCSARPASAMVPDTRRTSAPKPCASSTKASGVLSGIATRQRMPAAAAYAAAAAPALPAVGSAIASRPWASATFTARARPRALKE